MTELNPLNTNVLASLATALGKTIKDRDILHKIESTSVADLASVIRKAYGPAKFWRFAQHVMFHAADCRPAPVARVEFLLRYRTKRAMTIAEIRAALHCRRQGIADALTQLTAAGQVRAVGDRFVSVHVVDAAVVRPAVLVP